ncbi:sialate O-acetylesterase [Polaribacter sp. Hel_I_88]|uniref:sialate O-acetylesterase n=1 Tax=Polaribacter sp. Hel_I_88 TaxID=1250006 RepID=UPI000565E5D9|nr:sialate O-acetylesterase [Polaribacter sp. Hel_I_88]
MNHITNLKKIIFVAGIALLQIVGLQTINAEIKLPAIVSSNMVLQRNTNILIWGWANANEKIDIKTSWIAKSYQIKADKNGNWSVEIKTTNSKKPHTINLKSSVSNITLNNILFGEVWLCSGQSNMEQPIKGFDGQPTFGSLNATVNSYNPNLRLFTVQKEGSKQALNDIAKFTNWQEASSETVPDFSAIAYFFGQQLQEVLDVPVGLIHTSWGGSRIEAWMSNKVISTYQSVNLDNVDISKGTNQIPSVLFNAMINPLVNYKIKGALWYQGESNRTEPEEYKKLFPAMVKDWRSRWEIGEFPFYFVQIAPFTYSNNKLLENKDNSAFMREAQLQSLDLIPNSGIAITMDIGDEFSIHPPKKKEVADRLLYNALNKTYGFKNIDYNAPSYDFFEIQNGGIKLSFKDVETGIYSFDTIEDFEIAGADKVFYPAEAKIVNRRNIFVKSDKVEKPIAVRYAWKNWVKASLFDNSLLPLSSFRTDSWSDSK